MNTREILLAVRERMADPDRVVLDADSTYENADGARSYFSRRTVAGEPERACLLGWLWVFEPNQSGPDGKLLPAAAALRSASVQLTGLTPDDEPETEVVRRGIHLEVIDLALGS